jgi:hypothetical protein
VLETLLKALSPLATTYIARQVMGICGICAAVHREL